METRTMFTAELENVPARKALVLPTTTNAGDIEEDMRVGYEEIMHNLTAEGGHPDGPPFAEYRNVESENAWEVRLGIPVDRDVVPWGAIEFESLRAARAAVAAHYGPYDTINSTWLALQEWINDQGLEMLDPPWEEYLIDPLVRSPRMHMVTKIYWPVRQAEI